MSPEQKNELIKELNQTLKYAATCDESEVHMQGENIRMVFFTILEQRFTPEEINKVFEGIEITDERMEMIKQNDLGQKR